MDFFAFEDIERDEVAAVNATAEAGRSEPRRRRRRSEEEEDEEVKGGGAAKKPGLGRPSKNMLLGLPAPPSQLLLLLPRERTMVALTSAVLLLPPLQLLRTSLDAATSEREGIIFIVEGQVGVGVVDFVVNVCVLCAPAAPRMGQASLGVIERSVHSLLCLPLGTPRELQSRTGERRKQLKCFCFRVCTFPILGFARSPPRKKSGLLEKKNFIFFRKRKNNSG